MRRRRKQRFNGKLYGKPIGMYGLIFILAITIGIARDRNVKADDHIINRNIVATSSIYSSKDKTTNIIENGVEEVKKDAKSPPKTMPNYKLNLSLENQKLIYSLCQKNNLSYEFVLSVFHYESSFNPKAIHINTDSSRDCGFVQLNSFYTDEYRNNGIKYCNLPESVDFDVFNPDHSIRAGIGTLASLVNYWTSRGIRGSILMEYVTGSWNMGVSGFTNYIKQTGTTKREYSKQIQIRKDKLKNSNSL